MNWLGICFTLALYWPLPSKKKFNYYYDCTIYPSLHWAFWQKLWFPWKIFVYGEGLYNTTQRKVKKRQFCTHTTAVQKFGVGTIISMFLK